MNIKSTTVNYDVGLRSGKEMLTFTLCSGDTTSALF